MKFWIVVLIAFLQCGTLSKAQSLDKVSLQIQDGVYRDAVVQYGALGMKVQRGDCSKTCASEASVNMSQATGKEIVNYIQEHLALKSMRPQNLTYSFQVFTDGTGVITNVFVSHMPATPIATENLEEVTRVIRTIKFKRTSRPENSYSLWIKV